MAKKNKTVEVVEVTGEIKKVVRKNGVDLAEMVVAIPTAMAAEIPLGDVIISIQPLNAQLDLGGESED